MFINKKNPATKRLLEDQKNKKRKNKEATSISML